MIIFRIMNINVNTFQAFVILDWFGWVRRIQGNEELLIFFMWKYNNGDVDNEARRV